jgi:MSHA biogenesis protein MshK
MSLINDALKRASKSPPPPPVDAGAPFRPAEQPRRSPVLVPAISLIALVIFGLAGWFLYRGWRASHAAAAGGAKTTVAARENAEARRPGSLATNLSATATALASTNALAAAAASQAAVPPYKLNAIFYRTRNPSVVINSKTLYIGDKVAQAKVLAIDRESVTLEKGGQTNVLTLE